MKKEFQLYLNIIFWCKLWSHWNMETWKYSDCAILNNIAPSHLITQSKSNAQDSHEHMNSSKLQRRSFMITLEKHQTLLAVFMIFLYLLNTVYEPSGLLAFTSTSLGNSAGACYWSKLSSLFSYVYSMEVTIVYIYLVVVPLVVGAKPELNLPILIPILIASWSRDRILNLTPMW